MTDITTIIIAVYGAILSTVAIIWNIFRDKKKLKVNVSVHTSKYGDNQEEEILRLEAINIGKVPITLVSAGVKLSNNKNWNIKSEMLFTSIMLNESEDWGGAVPLNKFKEEINGHKPIYAWFKDNTGKIYKSKKMRGINNEHKL
ncbi:MAG: hypothetical protein ACP5N1_06250 [Candidatus Woesearchaeota archaeon]